MSEYGKALTARLEAVGLSRNGLARLLGHKGASQVSRWCAGKAEPRPKAQRAIEAALRAHKAAGGVPEVPQEEIGPQEGNTEATDELPQPHGEHMVVVKDESWGLTDATPSDLLLQMVNALAAMDRPGVTEADQVIEIESAAVEGARVKRVPYTNVWGRTYEEGEVE